MHIYNLTLPRAHFYGFHNHNVVVVIYQYILLSDCVAITDSMTFNTISRTNPNIFQYLVFRSKFGHNLTLTIPNLYLRYDLL